MSVTLDLDEAQVRLKDLVNQLHADEEVVITQNSRPIARLIGEPTARRQPRQPGNCQGMITLLVEDDEHLKDFKDYMP